MPRLLTVAACAALAACAQPRRAVLENHDPSAPEIKGLEHVAGTGGAAWVQGSTEQFRALYDAAPGATVTFSADRGALSADGDVATWQLPSAGDAALTVTLHGAKDVSSAFHFSVVPRAPTPVDTGTDVTGSACALAYDGNGQARLIYRNDTHPSLWYATLGTGWTTELVDGMGYNVGGPVDTPMALAVDASGNPDIAYSVNANELHYATKVGGTWTLERVDDASHPYAGGFLGLALDPANGNRPTIAYGLYSGGYYAAAIAYRTGAGAWTIESSPLGYYNYLRGGPVFDPAGTAYLIISNTLYAWTPGTFTASSVVNLPTGQLTRDAAGHVLGWFDPDLAQITIGSPLSTSSVVFSPVEASSVNAGAVAVSGNTPFVAVRHNDLEMVTPDARGYWTYAHWGAADVSTPLSVAIGKSGAPHVCYRLNSVVTFQ